MSNLDDILEVASGNKELKIGVEEKSIYIFGIVTVLAVFISVYGAIKLAK